MTIELLGGPLDGERHELDPVITAILGAPNMVSLPNDDLSRLHTYGIKDGVGHYLYSESIEERNAKR